MKLKIDPINIVDYISATVILIALFNVGDNTGFWLMYLLGCAVYVAINYHKQLYGQSIMNLIAGIIAIKNFIG